MNYCHRILGGCLWGIILNFDISVLSVVVNSLLYCSLCTCMSNDCSWQEMLSCVLEMRQLVTGDVMSGRLNSNLKSLYAS